MAKKMRKVFNIGLPKTGTTSLHQALLQLRYRSLHNPLKFRELSYRQGIYRYPDDNWDALTNFGEHFYPQLDRNYPDSRFILTLRDKERWLQSTEKWFSRRPLKPKKDNIGRVETFGCMRFNHERFSYVYDYHLNNVKTYFKHRPDDLLILNIDTDDSWVKLCTFLNEPISDSSFPHRNNGSAETKLTFRIRKWLGKTPIAR